MSFSKIFREIGRRINEPHEKFVANIILIVIFTFVYFVIHQFEQKSFYINPDTKRYTEHGDMELFDFFQFATLTQFGLTFGDIVPKMTISKICVLAQALLFWFVMLN